MSSSIALGCNGYEAHMQQILTLYGVYVVAGDHDFCLQKPPESSKTERKTQNHLSFLGCFWKCLAVSEEMILSANAERKKSSGMLACQELFFAFFPQILSSLKRVRTGDNERLNLTCIRRKTKIPVSGDES